MHRILERQEDHVRKIMQYQHRRHVFTLFIQDREMRFALWDRAGVLLSEPVDYLDNPDSLFKFLSGFMNANFVSQGYDETATLASPEQVRALERYTPNECYSDSARERLCLAKEVILGKTKTHRNLSPIYCVRLVFSSCVGDPSLSLNTGEMRRYHLPSIQHSARTAHIHVPYRASRLLFTLSSWSWFSRPRRLRRRPQRVGVCARQLDPRRLHRYAWVGGQRGIGQSRRAICPHYDSRGVCRGPSDHHSSCVPADGKGSF